MLSTASIQSLTFLRTVKYSESQYQGQTGWKGDTMDTRARNKIRSSLRRLQPFLIQAREQNINEADTVVRVVKVFEDVLGYNPLAEISREAALRDKYVDLVIKLDDVIKLIVEVKAAGVTLRDRHIEQAQSYASRNNYRWVVLTNGVVWNLYHLTFEEGIEYEVAFTIDLSEEAQFDDSSEKLGLLQHDSIRDGKLEDYWELKSALSPQSIGRAMFHEDVLATLRREIRRDAGILIDPEDLAQAIRNMLTPEVREQLGPLKIRKRRKPRSEKVLEPDCSPFAESSPVPEPKPQDAPPNPPPG